MSGQTEPDVPDDAVTFRASRSRASGPHPAGEPRPPAPQPAAVFDPGDPNPPAPPRPQPAKDSEAGFGSFG